MHLPLCAYYLFAVSSIVCIIGPTLSNKTVAVPNFSFVLERNHGGSHLEQIVNMNLPTQAPDLGLCLRPWAVRKCGAAFLGGPADAS